MYNEINNIEALIEASKEQIEIAAAVKRLLKNKDFKTIILDQYFTQYAADLVKSKAMGILQDEKNQTFIVNQINAIGHASVYLDMLLTQGHAAESALDSHEAERTAILEEEANY